MTTGTLCTVYVDGVRAADGAPGDDLTNPIILEDLAVTWGRGDTMSQPEPDTCTFDVMDQLGGTAFINVYRVGRRVDVLATGETYPDPTISTFLNPGFEQPVITWQPTAATAERTTRFAHSGTHSLAVKPTAANAAGSVLLAPGPFQEVGTNPDAWDDIPATSVGQSWSASLAVLAPQDATVTVRPVAFTGPYATAYTVGAQSRTLTGDFDDWQTVTFDPAVVETDNVWLGMLVTIVPSGSTWDELDPTLTWNSVPGTRQWDDYGTTFIDDVTVLAPGSGTSRSVVVFSGRITDLDAAWDESTGSPVVKVTAVGFTADLQNRMVGDEPWTVEDVDARANRILTLAGLPISIDIDTSIDDTLLSWRDVDAQGATGLLVQIAQSVDGVLWPAVHQSLGAYLRLEDPSLRASLLTLTEVLGPPPTVQRTNRVVNPDFETNVTGWGSFYAPTVTRDTTEFHSGTASCKVVKTNATQAQGRYVAAGLVNPDVGRTLHAVAWVKAPAGLQMRFTFKNTASGTGTSGIVWTTDGTWQRQEIRHTTNTANTTQTIQPMVITAGTADPAGTTFWFDDVFWEVDTDGDPFTGDTTDTPQMTYAWTGTAHASTSTETNVQQRTIAIVPINPTEGFDLSACEILRDPVHWVQDVSDVVTRAAVSWQEQGTDDEGNPTTTERTTTEIDAPLEVMYGTRRVAVSTQLVAEADAADVAARILARTSATDWRATGLTVDDHDIPAGPDGVALVLDMLDGTSRIGAPLVLGDMPIWSPSGSTVGVYLEGGTYRFVGGRWALDLLVSSASGLGLSAAWDEIPDSWQWDDFGSLTWNDLRGVAAPTFALQVPVLPDAPAQLPI